jgi:sugar-specific transcriptional regulator TrmB
MGEEPAAIREEIEEIRQQMGETLQQLAQKADVKGRAKEWVEEKRETVTQKVAEVKDAATHRVSDVKDTATEKLGSAKETATEKLGSAKETVTAKLPATTVPSADGDRKVDVVAMGKAGLTGVRAKVADRVATPVAARTGLTEDQVEAIIGAVFLALAAWQFARLVRRVVRAGRTGNPDLV